MKTIQKGDAITADWLADLVRDVRRNRVTAGHGLVVTRTPDGTVISAHPDRRPAQPAPVAQPAHAWAVRWSAAEESFQIYIPAGAARIFLLDPDTEAENRLAPGEVSIGLDAAEGGGDWYLFSGAAGAVWAAVSGGEITAGMAEAPGKGAIVAVISGSAETAWTVTQIARSPLDFFVSADDPDAPEPLPPDEDDDDCDQNVHPGDDDHGGEDDGHPGDGDHGGEDGGHPGDGSGDQDDSDHPGAADCYTTT